MLSFNSNVCDYSLSVYKYRHFTLVNLFIGITNNLIILKILNAERSFNPTNFLPEVFELYQINDEKNICQQKFNSKKI